MHTFGEVLVSDGKLGAERPGRTWTTANSSRASNLPGLGEQLHPRDLRAAVVGSSTRAQGVAFEPRGHSSYASPGCVLFPLGLLTRIPQGAFADSIDFPYCLASMPELQELVLFDPAPKPHRDLVTLPANILLKDLVREEQRPCVLPRLKLLRLEHIPFEPTLLVEVIASRSMEDEEHSPLRRVEVLVHGAHAANDPESRVQLSTYTKTLVTHYLENCGVMTGSC